MQVSSRITDCCRSLTLGALTLCAALSGANGQAPTPGSATISTIPPWVSTQSADWANAKRGVMLADMSKCESASALSATMKRRHWKTIPYELIGGQKGVMIWASQETNAPPVRVRLGVKGWYAIYVGVFSGAETPSLAWIKLSTDPAPVSRQNSNTDYYGNVQDAFFKVAELKGDETVQVAQQSSGYKVGCGVAFVKLIPLTPTEVAGWQADRNRQAHRGMTVTCDGFSFIYYRRPTTAEDLLAEIEPLRNTDVDTLILQSFGADKVSYPTKVGHMPGQKMDDYLVPGHRYFSEAVRELARKQINPVKVLIDGAHDAGIKVHVGIRPAGWSFVEPFTDFWETPFYKQHPEWRCEDRDGTPVTRLSWAVPEVRKHLVDLLSEMAGFGADGAHVVFNRGYPLTLYEKPFVDLFLKQHGIDPRKLEESDPHIAHLRSDIVMTFFREVRLALDQEQSRRKNGKRLVISAMLLGNEPDNLQYGVDVRRLVAEGLLDEISIYPYDFGARKGGFDMKFFREVCGPKGIPFRPAPVGSDPKGLLEQSLSFYEQGADGIAFWDASDPDINRWSLISRLGRTAEMRARLRDGIRKQTYYFFHRLGDNVMNGRYGPIWGG